MAPTLRSTQNSPTAAERTSNNNSPSTTPRKAPQCSKCKRPRAGHPRSGCPFVDSPSRETKGQDKPDNHLAVALGSMTLLSPAPIETKEDDKAFIRNRRRLSAQPELVPSDSLLSLSTNSSEIVARLLQPGMFDDTDEDFGDKGKISKVVRWQETIATSSTTPNTPLKTKTPSRSPMPGSLFPPTPESSFASTRTSDVGEISVVIRRSNIAVANPPVADDASSSHSTSTVEQRALPLARSMSALQREMFMSELKAEAKATLCVFDKADIAAMYAKAIARHKFVFQVMNNDKNDPQALLVVGQDEEAVHALLRQVEVENEKAKAKLKEVQVPKQGRPSNLGMAAGGVVVGAVGAWAGLAFS